MTNEEIKTIAKNQAISASTSLNIPFGMDVPVIKDTIEKIENADDLDFIRSNMAFLEIKIQNLQAALATAQKFVRQSINSLDDAQKALAQN